MTKRLVGVGVVIAVLAVNGVERPTFAQVISSGAQPRQSSPPPAGRIGSSRPSPAPLGVAAADAVAWVGPGLPAGA